MHSALFVVSLARLSLRIVEVEPWGTKGIGIFMGEDSKHSWGLKMDDFSKCWWIWTFPFTNVSDISDNALGNLVKDFMSRHGETTGEPFISGYFRSKNYHIQRSRVRASINRVEPSNTAIRRGALLKRRTYYVP